MNHRAISLRVVSLLCVVTCLVTPSWLSADEVKGQIQARHYDFKEAGKQMEYSLYVPKSYDKAKKSRLIVALHGLASNPKQIMRYPGFVQHAEKNNYIIVAPMGYNSRGWYGSRGDSGSGGSDPKNLGALSEKDVMNVIGIIRKEFNIDPERIYLLGHSMGGGGSIHLAMKYPDIWAAIAPIAPAIYGNPGRLEKAKHIPAIVIQGDKDRLVKVENTRRWIAKMKELEMKHVYIEVKGGGHIWVAFQHFPEIFKFFDQHPKQKKGGKAVAKPATTLDR